MYYCCCIFIRNTDKSSWPDFAELVRVLSFPVTDLLSWSEEDVRVHPRAAVLGAPLEASKDLYPELQEIYKHNFSSLLSTSHPLYLLYAFCICIFMYAFATHD